MLLRVVRCVSIKKMLMSGKLRFLNINLAGQIKLLENLVYMKYQKRRLLSLRRAIIFIIIHLHKAKLELPIGALF